MKKPKIRFKGFTDDWEQCKLRDVGTTYTGLSGKTKEDFGHGNGKFVTYMNVFSNPVCLPDITEPVEIDDSQNKVIFGDVLFTTSSETPEEVGMSSVWLGNAENTYLNSFCFGYRPTVEFNPYYLAYMLRSSSMRKKITFLAQGISRYNISKNKMMDIEIPIPNIEEQKQIGSYFRSLDHLITLHQRECEQLKTFKKYMLQNMFPENGEKVPKIRFKGFTDDWEQRKLGEIADKVTEKNGNNEYNEPLTNSAEQGIISQKDYFDREVVNEENLHTYYIVRDNDFVYNPRVSTNAFVGPINRNKLGRNGVMSPLYTVFRTHDINYTYLEYYYKTTKWHRFMKFNGDSGARFDRFTISSTLFMKMPIPYPSIEEQKQIGRYFSTLDNLLTLHQRKCEQLKKFKKYMLQNMFI